MAWAHAAFVHILPDPFRASRALPGAGDRLGWTLSGGCGEQPCVKHLVHIDSFRMDFGTTTVIRDLDGQATWSRVPYPLLTRRHWLGTIFLQPSF